MGIHTKEKLLVYEGYLKNYLSVMCNQSHYKYIVIWEPFAGDGSGSAGEVAKIIKDFLDKKNNIIP